MDVIDAVTTPAGGQLRWLLDQLASGGPSDEEVVARFSPSFLERSLGASYVAGMLRQVGERYGPFEPAEAHAPSPERVLVELRGRRGRLVRIGCTVDEADGRITGLHVDPNAELERLQVRVLDTGGLARADVDAVLALFASTYRQANRAHVEKSLGVLRNVAIAYDEGEPAGFALGETRAMPLPRLGVQVVSLAGICCVVPRFRRRGLFGRLEGMVLSANAPASAQSAPRRLSAGRMAHPASMRVMRGAPSVVPKPGVRPTAWQREVGAAIAAAYGAADFDPETFVCRGGGVAIGYPDIDIEVDPDEWDIFEPVDRDRGDALLAICWMPAPPDGWYDA